MRLVAGLAVDGAVAGVHVGSAGDPADKALFGMAANARGIPRGIASGIGMHGSLPLGALDVVRWGVMALVASAGTRGNANRIGCAAIIGMLTPRSVAVFALNIGEILQCGRQSVPIGGHQGGGRGPA